MKKSLFLLFICIYTINGFGQNISKASKGYENLVTLFQEWRIFENPPKLNGAPDYTSETFEKRHPEFENYKTD